MLCSSTPAAPDWIYQALTGGGDGSDSDAATISTLRYGALATLIACALAKGGTGPRALGRPSR